MLPIRYVLDVTFMHNPGEEVVYAQLQRECTERLTDLVQKLHATMKRIGADDDLWPSEKYPEGKRGCISISLAADRQEYTNNTELVTSLEKACIAQIQALLGEKNLRVLSAKMEEDVFAYSFDEPRDPSIPSPRLGGQGLPS